MVGPDDNLQKGPHATMKGNKIDTKQLKRIADAIEEILRLVKKDLEPKRK